MTRKYVMSRVRERKPCSICGKPAKGLGFCGKHYQNFKRLGKPIANQNCKNTIEDFLVKISELSFDEKGCKNWNRGKDKDGYGYYAIKGITYRSHRLLYITIFPGSYENKVVMHKCDNRLCCNISHLEVGSPSENTLDMVKKHRNVKGSLVGTSKFTEIQVNEIRSKYPEKSTIKLAKEYGVCKQTICNIINGTTYINCSHVNEHYQPVNKPVRVIL